MSVRYRLVVEEELGRRFASAFDGMTLSAHDGVTEITGPVRDPAHLQGILERVTSLGLTLRSVAALEPSGQDQPSRDAGAPDAAEEPVDNHPGDTSRGTPRDGPETAS
jgi:hypothetical protein